MQLPVFNVLQAVSGPLLHALCYVPKEDATLLIFFTFNFIILLHNNSVLDGLSLK